MSFFKKISKALSTKTQASNPGYTFAVSCRRCGEVINGRLNLNHDLSLQEDGSYFSRKVLIGSQRCFERVEVTFRFDARRNLIERQAAGGEFIEEAN